MIDLITSLRQKYEQFAKFFITGGIGYSVDSIITNIGIFLFDIKPLYIRIPAYIVAATTTWIINRNFAFRTHHRAPAPIQWLKYLTANSFSMALNVGIFQLSLSVLPSKAIWSPQLAVTIGSAVAMFFNYYTYKYVIFAQKLR